MADFNLSTIIKLTNDAFDLEELTDFCFLHFRPVYDQFQETDRKGTRVRMLIDHVQRRGQLADLLTLIQAENPGKYAQFAGQLGPLPPTGDAPPQAGITIAGDVHGDVVGGDKIGGDKVAGDKIEYRSIFNQSGQTVGTQYNVAGNLTIGSTSPASTRASEEQRAILRVIYLSQKENPNQFVDDVHIAEELHFDIEDVRMHLDLLEEKALVRQAKTFDGTAAIVTSRGRLIAQG